MRVLQVSKFYPPVMGGIEAVVWELTEGLNRAGVPTQVLCAHRQRLGAVDLAPGGYSVRRAGRWGTALSTSFAPAMPIHLARMAAQADLIHLHMPDPMAAAALWTVRPQKPLVVHWHSDVIRQQRALKLYQPLQDWLLRRADAIIATSPPYAESSVALRPWRAKVTVIPIGISDNHSTACTIKARALRQRFRGRRIVFALGRMTYYKGFDVLIDAAEKLPDDCVVLIGGEGELLEHYRAMVARRGLAGKVQLLGHIDDDDLASHFEACDIFCMSSTVRAEAYGVAILEAMVMGKPVVATDIPGSGVPWVNEHGHTGLNVPASDSAALTTALGSLLADEALRRRLGNNARARFESTFRAQRMTDQTLDLYRRVRPA
jgi:glycosyltransferase involved in cell wall biosynthesis